MWTERKPVYGDQIRVFRGFYYHHGIYEDDNTVYHFASPVGSEISPETAVVHRTTLKNFLNGGTLEVRDYNGEELKKKRKPSEIIEYAKAHLGEKGYNIVSNNCEHFSNRCAFGSSDSEQVKDVLSFLFGGRF